MAVSYSSLSPKAYDGIGTKLDKILIALLLLVAGGGGGSGTLHGSGSPEGVVTANVGTLYFDETTPGLWGKTAGSGNTGWTQLV